MIEIKVQCDCGQKYAFDVTPVNGQMPYTVACPLCGLDGTAKANQILREPRPITLTSAASSSSPPSTAVPAAAPIPVPMASVAAMAPAPAPVLASGGSASAVAPPPAPAPAHAPGASAGAPRLRISKTSHAEPEAEVAEAPAAASRLAIPAATPRRPGGGTVRAPALVLAEEKQGNFMLGVLGALGGALLGGVIYFFVLKYTELPITAIAVGFVAGLGGWWLGKPGGNELGVITATLSIACIITALYLNARTWWDSEIGSLFDMSYETQVEDGKELVKEIPNGTDEEIRLYLAMLHADEGELPKPNLISKEEIEDFRENTYNEAKDFATGKITREQFEKDNAEMMAKMKELQDVEEGTFKAFFVILLLTKSNIAGCVGAAGLAYKMSS